MERDLSQLQTRAETVVAAAKRFGADAADAVAIRSADLSVDVRDGKVEETERSEVDAVSLRVFVGKQSASVSSNTLNEIDSLAERAVAMARVAPEDAYAGLADTDRLAGTLPELDMYDETALQADQLAESARAAEDAAMSVPGVTKSGSASAARRVSGVVLVTSGGFSNHYFGSRYSRSVTAIAGDGTAMERDYDFSVKTHYADLDQPADLGENAGRRAVAALNPKKIESRQATIVYDPRVSSSLVGHLSAAVNGAAIARGTSFLKDRMGQKIMADGLTVVDDPTRPRGLSSRPFDGEGVAVAPLAIVEDGVLGSWILDCASARELGLETNGRATRGGGIPSPGSTNLALLPGTQSAEDLIGSVKSGLYITSLIGQGVNGVTGDYSRGASGFLIEDGELGDPVSEITIAGNLKDMFLAMTAADDLTYRLATNAPTIAIEDMAVAGR